MLMDCDSNEEFREEQPLRKSKMNISKKNRFIAIITSPVIIINFKALRANREYPSNIELF